jgi:hypothetical protein
MLEFPPHLRRLSPALFLFAPPRKLALDLPFNRAMDARIDSVDFASKHVTACRSNQGKRSGYAAE